MAELSSAFFLHGGPGGHCHVARAWFAGSLDVRWWDQPSVVEEAQPFQALVDAAAVELGRVAHAHGGAVHVIGFSYGTKLALELLDLHPERVASLTLLAPTLSIRRSFRRLARSLCAAGLGGSGLQRALDDMQAEGSPASFWALFDALLATPGLREAYWAPGSRAAEAKYQRLLGDRAPFDLDTFRVVAGDDLQRPEPDGPRCVPSGRARVVLGRADPLSDLAEDADRWGRILPQAELRVVDAGHWVYLETPPSAWYPDSTWTRADA